ncbi:MAG: hypothetical protein N2C12_17095 [Planctomycetales bacterium]
MERSQAGERVGCECGEQVEVPTLRDLGNLPSIEDGESVPRWTHAQGIIAVTGLLILLLGGWMTLHLIRSLPPQQFKGLWQHAIDLDSPDKNLDESQTLELWLLYRDSPKSMMELPNLLKEKQGKQASYSLAAWITGSLSFIVGFGLIIFSIRRRAG